MCCEKIHENLGGSNSFNVCFSYRRHLDYFAVRSRRKILIPSVLRHYCWVSSRHCTLEYSSNINSRTTTGTLLGEWNATTVTLCMLTGGEALERACMKNAERSLETLLRKRIHIEKCEILSEVDEKKRIEIPVADMKVGSRYVLRAGSHVPVDSEILSGEIVVDDSALTGEHVHKTISSDANKSKLLLSGSKVLSVKSSDSSGLAYAKALRVASKSTFELMKSALLEAKDSTSSLEIRSYVVFERGVREYDSLDVIR